MAAARNKIQLVAKKPIASIQENVKQEGHQSESAQECPNSPVGFAGRSLSDANDRFRITHHDLA
jgi:hypothetical protein